VEAAKALGGSFKSVTLAPKNRKGDDSTAQGNIKEWGHTNKSDTDCSDDDYGCYMMIMTTNEINGANTCDVRR